MHVQLEVCVFFFFQAEDGIRDVERSRGLGDVYKRQTQSTWEKMSVISQSALSKKEFRSTSKTFKSTSDQKTAIESTLKKTMNQEGIEKIPEKKIEDEEDPGNKTEAVEPSTFPKKWNKKELKELLLKEINLRFQVAREKGEVFLKERENYKKSEEAKRLEQQLKEMQEKEPESFFKISHKLQERLQRFKYSSSPRVVSRKLNETDTPAKSQLNDTSVSAAKEDTNESLPQISGKLPVLKKINVPKQIIRRNRSPEILSSARREVKRNQRLFKKAASRLKLRGNDPKILLMDMIPSISSLKGYKGKYPYFKKAENTYKEIVCKREHIEENVEEKELTLSQIEQKERNHREYWNDIVKQFFKPTQNELKKVELDIQKMRLQKVPKKKFNFVKLPCTLR
eukprot:TRINITY_DN8184_c0_g1_i1.p1 TRINITY_DN8184_c0_g1~~TRINITY_DN8184_c0_g1_i1.p1  ORF type:complete len:397 (+),score=97.41 TRINITY_DN8184_c0_g1_i1:69-1259(+)